MLLVIRFLVIVNAKTKHRYKILSDRGNVKEISKKKGRGDRRERRVNEVLYWKT